MSTEPLSRIEIERALARDEITPGDLLQAILAWQRERLARTVDSRAQAFAAIVNPRPAEEAAERELRQVAAEIRRGR